MKKIRVLSVSEKYQGEDKLLNRFVLGPDKNYFETLACMLSGESDGSNTLDKNGKAVYLGLQRANISVKSVRTFNKLLRDFKPHIIHAHRFDAACICTISSRLTGIGKVVTHFHGLNRIRSFRRKMFAKWLCRYVTATVCVSGKVKENMQESLGFLKPDNLVVLYNGIDIEDVKYGDEEKKKVQEKLNLNSDCFNIVNVGRLVPTKGQSDLIDGFSEAVKENDKLRLYFIGDGRLLEDLKAQAKNLAVEDKVFFLGFRDDVLDVMCGFDLFAFSSLAEGLPLSIIEAMAAKLPVVSTKAGGIPEIFEGAPAFGELVDIGDARGLCEAIKKIASLSGEEINSLGVSARARAIEGFSREVMIKNLEKIYLNVLDID